MLLYSPSQQLCIFIKVTKAPVQGSTFLTSQWKHMLRSVWMYVFTQTDISFNKLSTKNAKAGMSALSLNRAKPGYSTKSYTISQRCYLHQKSYAYESILLVTRKQMATYYYIWGIESVTSNIQFMTVCWSASSHGSAHVYCIALDKTEYSMIIKYFH